MKRFVIGKGMETRESTARVRSAGLSGRPSVGNCAGSGDPRTTEDARQRVPTSQTAAYPVGRGMRPYNMETTVPRPPCAATLRQAQGRQGGGKTAGGRRPPLQNGNSPREPSGRRSAWLQVQGGHRSPPLRRRGQARLGNGLPQKSVFAKRTQVYSSRRGKLVEIKPKTNPSSVGGNGLQTGPERLCRVQFALPGDGFGCINDGLPRYQLFLEGTKLR
jgi:hypothetical protein